MHAEDVLSKNDLAEDNSVEEKEQPDLESHEQFESITRAWNTHARKIRRCCRRWMRGHEEDGDEAFSRAWTRIIVSLPKSEIYDTRAWMFALAYRVCIDLYRERKRRAEEAIDANADDALQKTGLTTEETPERAYLAKELQSILSAAIISLPERLGKAVDVYLSSGSYQTVSMELGITEVNARKRIQQARAILRTALAQR